MTNARTRSSHTVLICSALPAPRNGQAMRILPFATSILTKRKGSKMRGPPVRRQPPQHGGGLGLSVGPEHQGAALYPHPTPGMGGWAIVFWWGLSLSKAFSIYTIQCNAGCAPGWTLFPHTGRCYKLFKPALSWTEAGATCSLHKDNGHLASVPDQETNDFLLTLFSDEYVWIGAHADSEGEWQWSDGTQWAYTNWDGGQPTGENQDFLHLIKSTKKWVVIIISCNWLAIHLSILPRSDILTLKYKLDE